MKAGGCFSLLIWTIACSVTEAQTTAESYHVGTVVGKSEPCSSGTGVRNGSSFNLLEEGNSVEVLL